MAVANKFGAKTSSGEPARKLLLCFKLFKLAAVYNLSDCLSGFTDNNSIALRFDNSFLEDLKEIIIILKNLALNLRLFVPSLKRLFITFGIFLADVFKIH